MSETTEEGRKPVSSGQDKPAAMEGSNGKLDQGSNQASGAAAQGSGRSPWGKDPGSEAGSGQTQQQPEDQAARESRRDAEEDTWVKQARILRHAHDICKKSAEIGVDMTPCVQFHAHGVIEIWFVHDNPEHGNISAGMTFPTITETLPTMLSLLAGSIIRKVGNAEPMIFDNVHAELLKMGIDLGALVPQPAKPSGAVAAMPFFNEICNLAGADSFDMVTTETGYTVNYLFGTKIITIEHGPFIDGGMRDKIVSSLKRAARG